MALVWPASSVSRALGVPVTLDSKAGNLAEGPPGYAVPKMPLTLSSHPGASNAAQKPLSLHRDSDPTSWPRPLLFELLVEQIAAIRCRRRRSLRHHGANAWVDLSTPSATRCVTTLCAVLGLIFERLAELANGRKRVAAASGRRRRLSSRHRRPVRRARYPARTTGGMESHLYYNE